jgi:hypothetical protein
MSDPLELRDHGGCDLILALVQPEIRADQRGHPLAQLTRSSLTALVDAEFIACTGQMGDGGSPKPIQS